MSIIIGSWRSSGEFLFKREFDSLKSRGGEVALFFQVMNRMSLTNAHTNTTSTAVHVGTPPPGFQEWTTTKVYFHGFANRHVESPEFTSLNDRWCLIMVSEDGDLITEGGVEIITEGGASFHIIHKSSNTINIQYGFRVNDDDNQISKHSFRSRNWVQDFGTTTPDHRGRWGSYFLRDSEIMSARQADGALVVEVRMKLAQLSKPVQIPFVPENPICKVIQGMFMDEKSADIMLHVLVEDNMRSDSQIVLKPNISLSTFPAHQFILQRCSTTLGDLCESAIDKTSPIQITGVSPDIFRLLLFYMYGGQVANDRLEIHAMEIIDAADKYGVTALKLEAESCFVATTTITTNNVLELLLYADSKNCALLKEAAMDFIVENASEVLTKVSLKDIPAGLYSDLLAAVVRGGAENRKIVNDSCSVDELSTMRISDLRRHAHERGFDVDGSREVLIDALKSSLAS